MIFNLISIVFTSNQVGWIVGAFAALVAIVAINVAVVFHLRRIRERKLCTRQLQQKRDELLANLAMLQNGEFVSDESTAVPYNTVIGAAANAVTEQKAEPFEDEDVDDVDVADDLDEADDADDKDEDTVADNVITDETVSDPESAPDAEILAVREMSATTREILGFVGEEYDRKQYYVRYHLGFEAKLREADDEVKRFYTTLINEIALYKGVKVKSSFRQQRVYKGHKTLGLIVFRGKTLCIAFALDPNEYAETKYRGIDKSSLKRFAKTPMLFKITSNRRLEYAKYLLVQLAEAYTIVLEQNPPTVQPDVEEKTRDELFVDKKLRIAILGEAPELDTDVEEQDEEVAEIVEETTIGQGNVSEKITRRVVYDRSFTAKVIQANDELKARYSELKNHIMSYSGVSDKASWKRESFKLGNKNVAAFVISGKTLCLFLALDPEQFAGTKYAVENMTGRRNSGSTPAMYRIKGDRRTAYAKQLIDIMMSGLKTQRTDRKPEDYTTPYKSTASLVRRGLIKQTETDAPHPFA